MREAGNGVGNLVRACAAAHLLGFAALVPVSLLLAPAVPLAQEKELAHLSAGLAAVGPWLPDAIEHPLARAFAGDSPLADRARAQAVFGALLAWLTLSFGVLLWALGRAGNDVPRDALAWLRRAPLGFAALSLLAYPVFTQDLWHSVAWGRMIAAGENPWYTPFSDASLEGLPLAFYDTRMTYGPLWGVVSAGLAGLARGHGGLDLLLQKLLLAACWIGSVELLAWTTAAASPGRRALALATFGWTPLSVWMSVGEGHNDVALALPLLAWLACWIRGPRAAAPAALAASALVKYVSLPLAALELIHAARRGALRTRGWWLAALGAGALGLALLALFVRDADFLAGAARMRDWRFLTPAVALSQLAARAGVGISHGVAQAPVVVACIAALALLTRRYVRRPDPETFVDLGLGVLVTVLFTALGHAWPWFWIWALAPAALRAAQPLGVLVLGLAIVMPFHHVLFLGTQGWSRLPDITLALFAAAVPTTAGVAWLLRPRRGADPKPARP